MINAIQGPGIIGQGDQQVRSTVSDPRKKMENRTEEMDYTLSFQAGAVETPTYTRTATINLAPIGDAPGFEDLLSRLLQRQGATYEEAIGGKPIEIDPETRAEAQALIAEDGYWGIEKTSERIFQFAIAGAGKDLSKLEEIKAAIDKGFGMAADALGGSLPEISTKTYDAIMAKLDRWAGRVET